jgi:polysaccharide pyruvyl transferase WcaK-like protein
MRARPLTIALPWHSLGHGNLGVDALTRANIAIVKAAAVDVGRTVEMVTLCSTGLPETVPDCVTIGPRPRIKPLLWGRSDYLKVLRRSDLVLDIGEGDSWADIYGRNRLTFHAGTKIAAIMLGKPLVLAPQTIGPFNNPVARSISNWVMNRSRAVFSRDTLSTAYLMRQNIKCEISEFIDVAFRLPFIRQDKANNLVRVGLNVSGLLYNGGYTGHNELKLTIDYVAFTHQLIAALMERGAEIHLVPHVTQEGGGNDDDRSVIPALRGRFPAIQVPDVFPDASAAKSFMSGLDFVVGGRMHACIGAFSAGTPVVPIAYSRKFNGLFGTLGYKHFVDGKVVDTATAVAQTLAGFDNRAQLAKDIQPGLELAASRLDAYQARIAAMLKEVA